MDHIKRMSLKISCKKNRSEVHNYPCARQYPVFNFMDKLFVILLILTIESLPAFAIVHGDVELLKTVALKHKANLESLLTWKGDAFEEIISKRGDSYDYMIKNKCIFAYDRLQNAIRWNKEPQENRFIVDGNSLRDINAFYNSAMIKDQSSYQYSALGLRDGKETYHLVIGDLKLARGWEDFCLDPRYFFTDLPARFRKWRCGYCSRKRGTYFF